MSKLTVGSLFAGIGGFDLGLERAGMEVKWQVEIDPFCRAVLEKHWPHVRRYEDVRTVHGEPGLCDRRHSTWPCSDCLSTVDVLCGGFPCQDISLAGPGAGLDGERSGLWSEFYRLIRELRPGYVLVENVAALLTRGLGRVLGDLAACGYDAEWDCIPAEAIGATHRRDRVWIVAYPHGARLEVARLAGATGSGPARIFAGATLNRGSWWDVEPVVGRVVNGLPSRVDRVRSLGNAIVPHIAEWIGRRIIEAEEGLRAA